MLKVHAAQRFRVFRILPKNPTTHGSIYKQLTGVLTAGTLLAHIALLHGVMFIFDTSRPPLLN